MDDTKASKAQNLARIRDNQRRSRARRKEYLNELETKLRNLDQMGIEASAEIQGAARRVLDENRKLRALLHKRGVPDSEIVVALGGTSHWSYEQISAVPSLNAMLERKHIPTSSSSTTSPTSTHSSLTTTHASVPSLPPHSGSVPRSTNIGSSDSPSPHSMVSSMDTPPGYQGSPFYNSPMTTDAEIKSEDLSLYMRYDQSSNNMWSYSSETRYIAGQAQPYAPSSCVDAANIIQTMRLDAGSAYETQMICPLPRQTAYVNNLRVYNDVNKYTSSQQLQVHGRIVTFEYGATILEMGRSIGENVAPQKVSRKLKQPYVIFTEETFGDIQRQPKECSVSSFPSACLDDPSHTQGSARRAQSPSIYTGDYM